MRQKIHPIGIRLGITHYYNSSWYVISTNYRFFVNEDQKIRSYISHIYQNCIHDINPQVPPTAAGGR